MVAESSSPTQPQHKIERQQIEVLSVNEALSDTVALPLVRIPGGEFLMGSSEGESEREESEGPQHLVRVSGFWMGQYPVTQAQWRVVAQFDSVHRELPLNPSRFTDGRLPVEWISWQDAQEFCDRLSAKTTRNYRLPTEAEWEYACRAHTTTPFHFGETITSELANYRASSTYGFGPKGDYRERTTEVGQFSGNAFGLFDMHGNVLEWCQDYWHESYEGAPGDGSAWLADGDAAYRILRGGSWGNYPRWCRSASRFHDYPGHSSDGIGFRVLLAPR